jgi:hypothetical protein
MVRAEAQTCTVRRLTLERFDAFTHKSTAQYSLAFEKASIIFNIAAVLSCHAANQARSDETGLKTAYHSFQASAGMFTYINENFLHAPSSDLSRETVKTLISITLAQAQEVFLEKQIADQKKVALLAKLSSQAAYLYSQAVEGVQENVAKGIFEKVWLSFTQVCCNSLPDFELWSLSIHQCGPSVEWLTIVSVDQAQPAFIAVAVLSSSNG